MDSQRDPRGLSGSFLLSLTSRVPWCAHTVVFLFAALGIAVAQDVPKGDLVAIKIKLRDEEHWIKIKLDEDAAPRHCANFKILAEGNFYSGMAFHRVIRDYLVQTGDPLTKDDSRKRDWGTGGVGYDLAPEIGLPHKRGAVGMARLRSSNPKKRSSGSQFYIMLTNASELDKDYTVFGEVVEGLDIVGRMSRARRDTNDAPVERIEVIETRIGEPGILNTLTAPITKMPDKMAEIPNPLSGLRNPFAKKSGGDLPSEPDSQAEFKQAKADFKEAEAQAKAEAKVQAKADSVAAAEAKAEAKAQAKLDAAARPSGPFGGRRGPFAKKDGADLPPGPKPATRAVPADAPETKPAGESKPFGALRNPFAKKDGADLPPGPKPGKTKKTKADTPTFAPIATEREVDLADLKSAKPREKGGFLGLFGRKDKDLSKPAKPRKETKKKSDPAADAPGGEEEKRGPIGRMIKKIW